MGSGRQFQQSEGVDCSLEFLRKLFLSAIATYNTNVEQHFQECSDCDQRKLRNFTWSLVT